MYITFPLAFPKIQKKFIHFKIELVSYDILSSLPRYILLQEKEAENSSKSVPKYSLMRWKKLLLGNKEDDPHLMTEER